MGLLLEDTDPNAAKDPYCRNMGFDFDMKLQECSQESNSELELLRFC